MRDAACVLLSGGMDSVAALHWARRRYKQLLAVFVDYGQANRDREDVASGAAARDAGADRITIAIADGLPRSHGILREIGSHDGLTEGLSPAFVPGRNVVFVACAAAHAVCHFPVGLVDIVIGANATDAPRFPDCREDTVGALSNLLRLALGRDVTVVAPWIHLTKREILAALEPDERAAVARSWSCYRGDGPCGTCSACVLRTQAFAGASIEDQCS